ncbi:MAG: YggS family pyridoxal phosphate-dependent enzyme [Actinomycetota bacterium]|nr:YggS family pyridoxal phosphate-dependent enzyme [Actinomycetota bacterium]
MVAERLKQVRAQAEAAAKRVGRDPAEITLVAVSKGRSVAEIEACYSLGQRDFGENRAAELGQKAPMLPKDIRWHFIGSLQTRQAKVARPYTDLLHSLDRARLVNAWAQVEGASPVLVQVNVAGEAQKHGTAPDMAASLVTQAIASGLSCVGLMTIPPLPNTPEDSREWFVALRELGDSLRETFPEIRELSMGMTDDFEVAIEEGATLIRVGRAIFGAPGDPARID